MGIFSEKKIDSHCHVLDPARFPYHPDVSYRPAGQEMGNAAYFQALMDCYAVHHALLVGPNSGYATDNSCLLDAIAHGGGRFKGIAVVPNDCADHQIDALQAQGVIGIAFNPSLMGFDFYADLEPLLKCLKSRDMWAQFQVEHDLLLPFLPMIQRAGVKVLIDHCGRPHLQKGLEQAGFQALLALGREGRAVVKISGYAKFSEMGYPFTDVQPYVEALLKNFGAQNCVWASDWPYLKAPYRLDYGPMLKVLERQFSEVERTTMLWDAPMHHFQFA